MAKGRKTGGRTKGTRNKLDTTARSAFLATFRNLENDLEGWIRRTAAGVEKPIMVKGEVLVGKDDKPLTYQEDPQPGKAAELLIRMAEYHFPKLGRTELTGADGEKLSVSVSINRTVKDSE